MTTISKLFETANKYNRTVWTYVLLNFRQRYQSISWS